jgi:hypothetical protein
VNPRSMVAPSRRAAVVPRGHNVSVSSSESSTRPPDTLDALASGSHALPSGPTTHAAADTRIAVSPAPTPPAAFAAAHHSACSGSDSSILPSSPIRTHAAG